MRETKLSETVHYYYYKMKMTVQRYLTINSNHQYQINQFKSISVGLFLKVQHPLTPRIALCPHCWLSLWDYFGQGSSSALVHRDHKGHLEAMTAFVYSQFVDAQTSCCSVLLEIGLFASRLVTFPLCPHPCLTLTSWRWAHVFVCFSTEATVKKIQQMDHIDKEEGKRGHTQCNIWGHALCKTFTSF